ncbi:hypothetical protein MMC25_000987 [Agyrium rufum]|nr:hypothetical protein [Agyrium rufum]
MSLSAARKPSVLPLHQGPLNSHPYEPFISPILPYHTFPASRRRETIRSRNQSSSTATLSDSGEDVSPLQSPGNNFSNGWPDTQAASSFASVFDVITVWRDYLPVPERRKGSIFEIEGRRKGSVYDPEKRKGSVFDSSLADVINAEWNNEWNNGFEGNRGRQLQSPLEQRNERSWSPCTVSTLVGQEGSRKSSKESAIMSHSELPPALRIGRPAATSQTSSEVPDSPDAPDSPDSWERPSPPPDAAARAPKQHQAPSQSYFTSTNPFSRKREGERKPSEVVAPPQQADADVWSDLASSAPSAPPPPPPQRSAPPPPSFAPPPPPSQSQSSFYDYSDESNTQPPSDQFQQLHVADHTGHSPPEPSHHDEEDDEPPLITIESEGHQPKILSLPETPARVNSLEQYASSSSQQNSRTPDYFSQVPPGENQSSPEQTSSHGSPHSNKSLPMAPPETPEYEEPPRQPPRPVENSHTTPFQASTTSSNTLPQPVPQAQRTSADLEALQASIAKQSGETYEIKHITWSDSPNGKTRSSPIMIQNKNGPCPLLALVNALTLTTPADMSTPLVETLRVRERVSLGLLLEAVFDELMSGRRGTTASELPDVGELYGFLITLHTGMNVNPRFTPINPNLPSLLDGDFSTNGSRLPGTFEQTKEMTLYSAFAIPLIHGWLPPRNHHAYESLARSAATYEDAQNILFHEEELDDKLQRAGLNEEEQQLFEDISSIKYFLSSTATQLTGYGLDTISESLAPGTVAILFRNDHFSTLYKHPKSGLLMTLVTDHGYSGHDEVVWETLVDIRGEGSEFLSGDFRPVGNTQNLGHGNAAGPSSGDGWTTVSSGRPRPGPDGAMYAPPEANPYRNASTSSSTQSPFGNLHDEHSENPISPNTEQEDHDLALALQLQEEEEARERQEADERRRRSARENELSQQFLERQQQQAQQPSAPANRRTSSTSNHSQTVRPLVPPRGGSTVASRGSRNNSTTGVRPVVSSRPTASQSQTRLIPVTNPTTPARPARPADPEAGEDVPPPTYEEAYQDAPYIPPSDDNVYSDTASINSASQASEASQRQRREEAERQRERLRAASATTTTTATGGGRGAAPAQPARPNAQRPDLQAPARGAPGRQSMPGGAAIPVGYEMVGPGLIRRRSASFQEDREECMIM